MKNKKRVLLVLIILIGLIIIILSGILICGNLKEQKIKDYYKTIEAAACKLATEENYTESICEAFTGLCKIKYEKLISRDYIKNDLVNPETKIKTGDNTSSYVEITWNNDKMICTHKEG